MSSYLGSNLQNNTSEEEVDLKEIFAILVLYKKSIIIIALLALIIGGAYAYFKVTIYEARLSVEIFKKQDADAVMLSALGSQEGNIGNEVTILRSRSIALKTLELLELETKYFVYKNFKTVELYGRLPFVVHIEGIAEHILGSKINLRPVDENSFRLSIKPDLRTQFFSLVRSFLGQGSNDEQLIHFSQVFSYGEKISNSLFTLTVIKRAKLANVDYAFSYTPNESLYGMIQSSLRISGGAKGSSILYLSYQDNIPNRGVLILDTLVQVYESESIKNKTAVAKNTLKFINKQLSSINSDLQSSGSSLKKYKSSHTIVNIQTKATAAAAKLDGLETQVYELETQESVLKYLLNYLENNEDIVGIDAGSGTEVSAPIASLIGKIQAANSLYASMQADYTQEHPSVIKVVQELVSLKASLRGTIESGLRGTNERKRALKRIISRNKIALKKMPLQEQELSELTRNYKVNEGVYDYLLQKRVEAAIVHSSTDSGMRVLDSAMSTGGPVKPNRMIITVIGLLVGLILGIVQAFLRSMLANKIQSLADIEKKTFLPIYAVLPFFNKKKTLYEDTLRVLLTKLEFSDAKPKVITITSSVKGEGRTTTAIEFAKIIATSRSVILIDFDLRRSKVHEELNLTNSLGVSTLLSGMSTLDEVIQKLDTENLDVITSGPVPSDPYKLIMSDILDEVMIQLRGKYDYIIIQSPVAGLVADALVLMRLADISLIIFKAKYSKKSFLKNTNRFVQEHGLENVGIILNGLELKKIRPWLKK